MGSRPPIPQTDRRGHTDCNLHAKKGDEMNNFIN